VFPALLFIAFPIFSALMLTSIVYDIMHPRPAQARAQPAPQVRTKPAHARPTIAVHSS
jgi:hypothetical protein